MLIQRDVLPSVPQELDAVLPYVAVSVHLVSLYGITKLTP